ncbi:MAG: glycosyltransferase [Eubacterium sp.]|nr:glycosyltransferase [Eubacterium sp.]
MKKRYIFFKGLIDTLDLYTDEYVNICSKEGAECLVIDAGIIDRELIRLKAFLIKDVTAVISMNNIGMHLEFEDGLNIWDQYQIPFYNILMDHPFHYKAALDRAPEQMILLCMDRNHVEYVKRFFPNIKRVAFFPHAGIELQKKDAAYAGESCYVPIEERKIDVLYAGGLSRYAAEGLIPDLGSIREFDAFELVKNALEKLINNPELTTEHVIEQCLQEINFKINDKKLGETIAELRFLDALAVSFYREQAVRILAENGVTVTVFGVGWDRCEWESPNVVYAGVTSPAQILELMNQSKIVLNTMTWFKQGAHDRIFNGMLAGAAVVSDRSEYVEEIFTKQKQLQLFSLDGIKELPEIVQSLLQHPRVAQDMADCGYEETRRRHMWINRLQDIGLL